MINPLSELKIPGTYNLATINCPLTENHSQHEEVCQRKVLVIMTTKPEPTSITANYLKKQGWPSHVQPI